MDLRLFFKKEKLHFRNFFWKEKVVLKSKKEKVSKRRLFSVLRIAIDFYNIFFLIFEMRKRKCIFQFSPPSFHISEVRGKIFHISYALIEWSNYKENIQKMQIRIFEDIFTCLQRVFRKENCWNITHLLTGFSAVHFNEHWIVIT